MKKTIYFLFILAFQFTFSQSADILLNGTVSAENNQIKNVSTPTDSNDAATKSYVDSSITDSNNNQSINSSMIGLSGSIWDIDGNIMYTIIMCDGSQWTVTPLSTTIFNNGDPIPLAASAEEWANNENPAYSNGLGGYGKVYNWWVIQDERGIAPEGWHVANEEDWASIVECLGGEEIAGGKLKGHPYWQSPNVGGPPSGTASNSSGLSVRPAGSREGTNGNYYNEGTHVAIWQDSNRTDNLRPFTELVYNQASANFGVTDFYDGLYILLVRD